MKQYSDLQAFCLDFVFSTHELVLVAGTKLPVLLIKLSLGKYKYCPL